MDILISNSDGIPIYEQIYRHIKALILDKTLSAGDALPSMRLLASELKISVITTKRAYEELERDGYIESFTGRGSFVKAQSSELIREENLKMIDKALTEACDIAKKCGITADEIIDLINIIYKGD